LKKKNSLKFGIEQQALSPQLCSQANSTLPNHEYIVLSMTHGRMEGLVFEKRWGWVIQSW
jgi:hypothetical protein